VADVQEKLLGLSSSPLWTTCSKDATPPFCPPSRQNRGRRCNTDDRSSLDRHTP